MKAGDRFQSPHNIIKPGEAITAGTLNRLAQEVFETVEVGPGLTKSLSGNRVVIGLSRQTGGGGSSGWVAVS